MFLVVGESLVDLISEPGSWRFQATPGGSPLNVAVGLAAAGARVRLASEVGGDLFGELVREHLRRHRVETSDLAVTAAPTSLAFAQVDQAGVASYDFRFSWQWPGPAALSGVTCLHTGSLATAVPPGADAVTKTVAAARAQGVTVSYDPNIRPALVGDRDQARSRVERLVAATDLVKVSQDDLAWLYPDTPHLAAAQRWARRGPALVVVTLGAAGAAAVAADGEVLESPAPPAQVVDTVGAGDAFTAGLLAHLARSGALPAAGSGRSPARADRVAALAQANAAAAAACERRGAAPPPP